MLWTCYTTLHLGAEKGYYPAPFVTFGVGILVTPRSRLFRRTRETQSGSRQLENERHANHCRVFVRGDCRRH